MAVKLAKWQADIQTARQRIQSYVRKTPLEFSPLLSEKAHGSKVYIKLESEQVTGSFKVRGACNKIFKLAAPGSGVDFKAKPPICASTGNHGLACNYALSKIGLRGTTFVPGCISLVKEEALARLGAEVVKYGSDCMDSEVQARKTAEDEGRTYISPYNDDDVIAGQGTIGMEVYEELPDIDVVLVPVGGGGLISGIAAYLKAVKPEIKVIGCQPERSKVMYESVRAGRIIFEESQDTLSDGTAGGIEDAAVTFPFCQQLVDDWIMVSEEDISKALYFMMEHHHKIVEGAAGCSIGAFTKRADDFKNKTVAIVACGSNISIDKIKAILQQRASTQ